MMIDEHSVGGREGEGIGGVSYMGSLVEGYYCA
jgi:hypothetical protein